VNDHQLALGELAGYRLLFLTNPRELSSVHRQRVDQFRARGGVVVENRPDWAWSDPALRPATAAAFRAAIAPYLGTAPVVVTGGPQSRYAVSYRGRDKLVVAVTNDFDWVQVTRRSDEEDGDDTDVEEVLAVVNPQAPDAAGVQVAWRRGHGLPQSWFHTRLHRLQAVDAATPTGVTLPVRAVADGYRVAVPPFSFMALVVVTRAPGWPFPLRRRV
jgi:hypothetical protein